MKGICEHGRMRARCKQCGGNGICEHNRERRFCKECVGSAICEHGTRRHYCKECQTERDALSDAIKAAHDKIPLSVLYT